MFINKFNQLIRNKWVWGIFAVLVCFLFVAPDLFRGGARESPNAYGTLSGKPVSYEEFQNALLAVRIDEIVRTRGMSRDDDYAAQASRAWRFVAAERTARDLGLVVSKTERKQALVGMFSDGTGFNQAFYASFVRDRLGCSPVQFERALGTALLVHKVADAHAQAAWLSPSFLDVQSRGQTDRYTLRLVSITNAFSSASVEPSRETLQAHYEQNIDTYRVPDRASARYVIFRASDFNDKVGELDEDAARLRYDDDPSKYTDVVDGVRTNLSFEAAQPRIENELRAEAALRLAVEAADAFAEIFYNDRRDPVREAELLAPDFFERTAAEQGRTVLTTALFSASSPVVGIESAISREFSETAFGLSADASYHMYSTPIEGKANAYVLAFGSFEPTHEPGLDAVLPAVTRAVVDAERSRMFGDDFRKRFDEYTAHLAADGFEKAAADAGFSAGTNMVLTAYDARLLPGDAREWITILPRLDKDDDSPPVFYGTGAAFVHVIGREDGDETLRANFRERYADSMAATIASSLSESWLEDNYQAMEPVVPGESDEDAEEE